MLGKETSCQYSFSFTPRAQMEITRETDKDEILKYREGSGWQGVTIVGKKSESSTALSFGKEL